MSSPAPPGLEESVSGDQSESDSEVEESAPETGLYQWGRKLSQALHQLGVNPLQHLSPQGQSIHGQWETNILPKGRTRLADPRVRCRLKRVELKEGERQTARLAICATQPVSLKLAHLGKGLSIFPERTVVSLSWHSFA